MAPRVSQDALQPMRMHQFDRGQPPEQADMLFVGGYRVYGPQNALMQWRRIIAETQERFEGHTPFTPHKKHIRLLGGLSPINPTRRRGT